MQPSPVILFGAFDRHNFGDLLFPHLAAAMLPGCELHFAGLAERDLRPFGGHLVRPLAAVAAELATRAGAQPATLLHVGGEILGCDAWQAAVMLLPPDEARTAIARLDARPVERRDWARQRLAAATGDPNALAPYVASREHLPRIARIVHAGVGGVALAGCEPAFRAEVLGKLAAADAVGVRDRRTLQLLEAAGLRARLVPDPAAMVAELFGARIAEHGRASEPARVRRAFPQGYLAVQFAAESGDDDTLGRIAGQFDRVAAGTGLGIVLFRAGAAPWHDDIAVLRRGAARMRPGAVLVFESLQLWDICALVAASRGYCGSSLHGRIVAMAFGLPRVSLAPREDPAGSAGKLRAYAETWESPGLPDVVDADGLAAGLRDALAADPAALRALPGRLAAWYRQGFDALMAGAG